MKELRFSCRPDVKKESPQGKLKVYFSCYPDDFDRFFLEISESILKIADCVIWYLEEKDTVIEKENAEDYYCCLDQMCLFVIPVTNRLLSNSNCRALKVDMEFAKEHNIPLLMIMEERGLENEFRRICGDIQFLDRNQDKLTQKTYIEKLSEYLSRVLISNVMVERVRKAFDAYIFLSYRKKDRKEALKVMKAIHNNDFMRDVAIWFDEYLVPGEDFNDAIEKAIEKSQLFSMVVTPNLKEPNYIMSVEYPLAVKKEKRILPIETVPTDKTILQSLYVGIPESVILEENKKLNESLKEMFIREAWKENGDQEHLYYMGLAYVYGIDVEKDVEKGIEILKKSANCEEGIKENSYSTSMVMLSDIYKCGTGVRADYEKAIFYGGRCLEYLERYYSDNLTAILEGKRYLSILLYEDGRYYEALAAEEEIYEEYVKNGLSESDECRKLELLIAHTHYRMGNIGKSIKIYERAYLKCKNNKDEDSIELIRLSRLLSIIYSEIGETEKAINLCEEAKDKQLKTCRKGYEYWYTAGELAVLYAEIGNDKKALPICDELNKEIDEGLNEPYDKIYLTRLVAKIYRNLKQYEKANVINNKLLCLVDESFGLECPEGLAVLTSLALNHMELNNDAEGIEYALKAYNISKEKYGIDNSETIHAANTLAACYMKTGEDKKVLHIVDEIWEIQKEKYFEQTITIEQLNAIVNTAIVYEKCGFYDNAIEVSSFAYNTAKKQLNENDLFLLHVEETMAYCLSDRGWTEAIEHEKNVYEKRKMILSENHHDTIEAQKKLASYYSISGNYEEALNIYSKLYDYQCSICGENSLIVMDYMYNIGCCYDNLKNYIKATEIFKDLYVQYRRKYGKYNENTYMVLKAYIHAYTETQSHNKIIVLGQEAVNIARVLYKDDKPKVVEAMYTLSSCYCAQKDYKAAEKNGIKTLEMAKECIKADDPKMGTYYSVVYYSRTMIERNKHRNN